MNPTRIGIISDTHGLLRPEAIDALAGVNYILHAGDIGDPAILDTLARIAPTTAIRGNIDTNGPCAQLPPTEAIEIAGHLFYLVHSIHDLDLDPAAAQIAVIVSGHSHQPSIERRGDVLYLNPGSAGPRRFRLPISLAIVEISAEIAVRIVELAVNP
jgi:putative phosphoesterase